MKFDHLNIPVSDLARSRDWYISTLGLWFQVEDVDAIFAEWSARGVAFAHGPQKNFWGYGSELADPDGYLVRLWDVRTMREK